MKELSIEEKAQAYDDALEKANALHKDEDRHLKATLERIFPELADESEDERIRKVLVEIVKCNERSGYTLLNNVSTSSMLAWLEKQGERKYNWNEEDEHRIELLKALCEDKFLESVPNSTMYEEMRTTIDWLKSLKNRVLPQPKQEWSEDDKEHMASILTTLLMEAKNAKIEQYRSSVESDIDWIYSLKNKDRVQPKQKWSEEDETNSYHLKTLLENLAKDIKHEFRVISDDDRDKYTAWLESIKDRVQPKQEWSERDKNILNGITSYLCTHDACELDGFDEWYNWLKSLKQRIGG